MVGLQRVGGKNEEQQPAAGGAASEPLNFALFGQINTSTPNPTQSLANKDNKRTRGRIGGGGWGGGPGASWEIIALIKPAGFLSPSAGIMCLAHYSPDYCFSAAITGKGCGGGEVGWRVGGKHICG